MPVRRLTRALPALLLSLYCGVPLGASGVAQAATPEDTRTAQRKTQEGAKHMEAGRAEEALHLFQEAYGLTENARYQYNIGVACAALDRNVEALEAFERFAAQARGITREHRRDAEAKMDGLKKKVAELEVTSDETGVEVRLDGRRLGSTPLPGVARANVGAHVIMATKSGFHPFERKVELARGTRTRLELVMTPMVTATAPPPMVQRPPVVSLGLRPQPEQRIPIAGKNAESTESSSRVWLWAGVGATVIAGVVVGVLLLSRGGNNPTCPPEVQQCIGQ